jgi:hypothetical protein
VFFGLGAGAFTTSSGDLVDLRWANTGTFLGAVLPRRRGAAAAPAPRPRRRWSSGE